jgi:PadR family transcriptional regulator
LNVGGATRFADGTDLGGCNDPVLEFRTGGRSGDDEVIAFRHELIIERAAPLPPPRWDIWCCALGVGPTEPKVECLLATSGPAHGHEIAKHILRTTEEVLQVEHGSLYPALHRLEKRGWLASKWQTAKDRNREFKYYRLTAAGKKQLTAEESKWKQLAGAIARVMWPAKEG